MEMKIRFDQLDAMDENDPNFIEDEYDNLDEIIETKQELLMELRSQQ